MPRYRATHKINGEIVEYDAAEPQIDHLSQDWELESVSAAFSVEDTPVDTRVYAGRRRITKLEFVALLGDLAYVAILNMARESVQIEAWVRMLELATPDADGTSVDLDASRTVSGIQAIGAVLHAQGIVSDTWAQEVLHG